MITSYPKFVNQGQTGIGMPQFGTTPMYLDSTDNTYKAIDYAAITNRAVWINDSNGNPIDSSWLQFPTPSIRDTNGADIISAGDIGASYTTNQLMVTSGAIQVIDSTTYTESYSTAAGGCISASATASAVKTISIGQLNFLGANKPSHIRIKAVRIYAKGFDPTNYYFTLNVFNNTALSGTYTASTLSMIADLPSMIGAVQFARTGAIVGTSGNTYGFTQVTSLDMAIPLTYDIASNGSFKYVLSCSGVNSAVVGNKFFVAFDIMIG